MLSLSEELDLINRYRETAPVNVEGLVRELGISLMFVDLDKNISGKLQKDKDSDLFYIMINTENSETHQRFTIAHEIGHYMLHRSKIGNGIEDNLAYRSTEQGFYKNKEIGSKQETEANQFAANLLMPSDLIRKLRRNGISDNDMANKLGVSKRAMEIRLERFQ